MECKEVDQLLFIDDTALVADLSEKLIRLLFVCKDVQDEKAVGKCGEE